jgi:DNA-directed RNA polymerase specialized sigma subunit
MKHKDFSCDICEDRNKCKKPCCWLKHELSLVTARQKEKPIPIDDRCQKTKYPDIPTTSEIIFTLYFIDRQPQADIAKMLSKSQQYISKCIRKHKQILLENLKK